MIIVGQLFPQYFSLILFKLLLILKFHLRWTYDASLIPHPDFPHWALWPVRTILSRSPSLLLSVVQLSWEIEFPEWLSTGNWRIGEFSNMSHPHLPDHDAFPGAAVVCLILSYLFGINIIHLSYRNICDNVS